MWHRCCLLFFFFFFFQAEDGIRDVAVTGVQTCALPISRAKLVDRFVADVGRPDIPVAAGTPTVSKGTFTQRRYAEGGHYAKPSHPDAVAFVLEQINRYPGQVTLIAIGPLMNVGGIIDKDAATF